MACERTPSGPSEIAVDRVVEHAQVLATQIGPRPYDSDASARAAAYIEQQLASTRFIVEKHAVGSVDIPAIVVGARTMMPARHADVHRDHNLVVRIRGTREGPALLLMAHYDTVADSPGAIDNATAIGILLELAQALARTAPARPVVLAFTAAEEPGLAGSTVLATSLGAQPIGLAVSLDLVGHARSELNGMGPLVGNDWRAWIDGAARDAGVAVPSPRLHRIVSRTLPQLERSDHAPFAKRGIPAFHLYGRGDVRIFRAYHSPWDTPAWIDRAAVDETSRFLVGVVRREQELPAAGGDPGLWLSVGSKLVVLPRSVAIAAGIAFALACIAGLLVGARRRQPPGEGRRMGLLLAIAMIVLAWVVTSLVAVGLAQLAGNRLVWLHAPVLAVGLAFAFAAAAALLGWLGLLQRRPLAGDVRFTAAGALPLLAIGGLFLASGIHELAWAPLLSSAVLAVGGLARGWLRAVAWVVSLAVIAPAIAPAFLQEIGFQMIYPPELPLPAYLGAITAPHVLAALPLLPRWRLPPRAPLVVAAIMLALAGVAIVVVWNAPCDGEAFARLWLGCEIAR